MSKSTTITSKKLRSGVVVRLQKRGNAFDVIRNSTGYCWMYVAKALTEAAARDAFDMATLELAA